MFPCLLVASTVAEYREQIRGALRQDAPSFVLGALIIALGFGAILAFATRKKIQDPAPLWFGVFAFLYGTRLIFDTEVLPFVLAIAPSTAEWVRQIITYLLPIPGVLFGYYIFPAWKQALRRVLWLLAAFCVIGIATDLVLQRPGSLHLANNVITLLTWACFAFALFRSDNPLGGSVTLRWGLGVFGICLALGNLRGLGLIKLPSDPEPFGFACFLIILGRFLAKRTLTNEARLRAIDQELEIATRIQLSILPREMPKIAGLQLAASYLPMTSVAGDFYDFLPVGQKRVGILIADVSGHGVPAALIASMVKIAIAAQIPHAEQPAQVLTGMNQILCGKMQGQFVSAAYLFLDLENRKLHYSAAGHPPLLWWKAQERTTEALEQNGLLLGIMSRAPYTAIERDFHPGDRFLLYTDGLVEGADASDIFFGEERVRETLSSTSGNTAQECAQTLLQQLGKFAGHDQGRTQDDDLTVIVVDAVPVERAFGSPVS